MSRPLITLTTDFGTSDSYVAQMKGVILGINPEAQVVDISHAVPPQDVRRGALLLDRSIAAFPPGTLHVGVVDPGVGSARSLVGVEMAGQRFLAPDNGLLSAVIRHFPPERAHRLEAPEYWRHPVSETFHGRDVLAPVAAHWSRGTDLDAFGPAVPWQALVMLPLREARRHGRSVVGEIDDIDAFGNLITNIDVSLLPRDCHDACVVELGRTRIDRISHFYGEQPAGTLLALFGSSGRLEIAVNLGNAAEELGLGAGTPVRVVPTHRTQQA